MQYLINDIDLSTFGIRPSRIDDSTVGVSGIFDFPKRKGETEYNWGTEIEAFVSADDLKWESRDITFKGLMKAASRAALLSNLQNFAALCKSDEVTFSTPFGVFLVVLENGISVKELRDDLLKFEAKFTQQKIAFTELSLVATGGTGSLIDNYNLRNDFGIIIQDHENYLNVAKRLDVNTTGDYKKSGYREMRDLSVQCLMVHSSMAALVAKMGQFHALLASPGLKTLITSKGDNYACYVKDGFTVSRITTGSSFTAKFNLKLRVV